MRGNEIWNITLNSVSFYLFSYSINLKQQCQGTFVYRKYNVKGHLEIYRIKNLVKLAKHI